MRITVIGIAGVPEVREGDDLGELLVAACAADGVALADGDVVCVAQKVVSKAEGATVAGSDRWQVARQRSVRTVARSEWVLVVETHHGFVCANAGVDASNVAGGSLTVLPEDPDHSARSIAGRVLERTGARVGVIVTDTFGRPWRMGQTDVAIGVAGIAPLRDERGGMDRSGRPLEVTLVAIADELSAAADLVRTKASGTPFVVVRGAPVEPDPEASVRALVRPSHEDLFRWGGRQGVFATLEAMGVAVDPGPPVQLSGEAGPVARAREALTTLGFEVAPSDAESTGA